MGASAAETSTAVESKSKSKSKSPTRSKNPSPPRPDAKPDTSTKADPASNANAAKPLAPPPRPGQQGTNTPDFFTSQPSGSLSLEPNPFEQSFGGGGPETPGGTKLPSVAALTSPSSLLPGTGTTPFNWGGGSLRTGPLSPAMLSGPATDYFTDSHLRGGFPTPNESSLRSGLTPGGSGSMFPAPSPNSQALFAQLASGGATPNTLDFHRTALSAAAKRDANQQQQTQLQQQSTQQQNHASSAPAASHPQGMANGSYVKNEAKSPSGPFDGHDNDAANGLYMLAQGRNGASGGNPPANHAHPTPAPAAKVNGNAAKHSRDVSEVTNGSEENDDIKPARGKGKKTQPTNARRKAEEPPAKTPAAKKAKGAAAIVPPPSEPSEASDDDDDMDAAGRSKMTDEDKRKNFLERNRVAALKCRQRKKQWLANLQAKVEMFSTENDALTSQITQLREEVVNLKTLLLAHKDCPVTQQQGLQGGYMQPVMEQYGQSHMQYPMGGPMPNQQQVMAGQGVQRRFS